MMKGALSIRRLRKPPAKVAESPRTNPAGCAINGGEQVRASVRVRHLWQIVDVDMHKARLIRLKGLHRRLSAFLLGQQGLAVGNPVAAQTAVRTGAGDRGVDELSRVTTSRSSSDSNRVLRSATTTTSRAGVSVVGRR